MGHGQASWTRPGNDPFGGFKKIHGAPTITRISIVEKLRY